jgi:uncharacterized protein (DUF1330 family)
MPAWVIGTLKKINDPVVFAEYQKLAGPTLEPYGGKVVGGGTKVEVGDGDWSPITAIIVEFESIERAREWYNGPEYQAALALRLQSTESSLILVDGG